MSPGDPDSLIKVFVCRHMTMIDTHQPATVSETPTDATILDQCSKPSPDIRVLSIGR